MEEDYQMRFLKCVAEDNEFGARQLVLCKGFPEILFDMTAEHQIFFHSTIHFFWDKIKRWNLLPKDDDGKFCDTDRKIYKFLQMLRSLHLDITRYFVERIKYSPKELEVLMHYQLSSFWSGTRNLKLDVELISFFYDAGSSSFTVFDLLYVNSAGIEMIQLLLSKGIISLETQDSDGNTLLHHICCSLGNDVIRYVLKQGANQRLLNHNNETCLEYLLTECDKDDHFLWDFIADVLDVLMEHGLTVLEIITLLRIHRYNCYNTHRNISLVLFKHGATFEQFGSFFDKIYEGHEEQEQKNRKKYPRYYLKELLNMLDLEMLQISKGTASESVLEKLNSVFLIDQQQPGGMAEIPNLFITPYAELIEASEQFTRGFAKFLIKGDPYFLGMKTASLLERLRLKVETLAVLAHTTALGRQQALQAAQMDTQGFCSAAANDDREPADKKLKK